MRLITFMLVLLASSTFAVTDITSLSAKQQIDLMQSGELTSEQIVAAYIDRIQKMNRNGPSIQAMISLNPNALAQAKTLDAMRKSGDTMGPLHGVVVIAKDNIETSELPTTAGSLALINNDTGRDAPIIQKLKDAGAIILGKTNLSEWANFRSESSISGWSAVGGQTRNPHSLDRTACGSSSGTGAAIAASFAAMGIGTETNGSIICPAAMNGIVGVKPTVGLWSRHHIVPISVTQDTAGPMTRSVYDAALLLEVAAGSDEADPATKDADGKKQAYTNLLGRSVEGLRIGVLRSRQSNHPEIIDAFNSSLAALEAMGVELVDIDSFEMPEEFWSKAYDLLLIEFKEELNKYLASTGNNVNVKTLEQLIAFNNGSPRELALFDQNILEKSQATEGYNAAYEDIRAFLRKATRDDGIDKLLREYKVDAIVAPSQNPAFLIDAVYGDNFNGGTGAGWLAAIAGYPQVSIPMGTMKGLPVNFSFMGTAWSEGLLLNLAYQLEQQTQAIVPPTFAPNAFEHDATSKALRVYHQ